MYDPLAPPSALRAPAPCPPVPSIVVKPLPVPSPGAPRPTNAIVIPDLTTHAADVTASYLVRTAPPRFHWRLFLAIVSAGSAAMAATVSALWIVHRPALHVEVAPVVTVAADTDPLPSVVRTSDLASRFAPLPAAPVAAVVTSSARVPAPAQPRVAEVTPTVAPIVHVDAPGTCVQSCRGNVSCILACPAYGGGNGAIGQAPTLEQIDMAEHTLRGAVLLCGMDVPDAPDHVDVSVTFGSDGRVIATDVPAPFTGTIPGRCMERAVRRAHLPPFLAESFTASMRFAVR